MSTINVDIISPQSDTKVTVSGVEVKTPNTGSTALGKSILVASSLGNDTVMVGDNVLKNAVGAEKSVVIGKGSCENSTNGPQYSVAIGFNAMKESGESVGNTAIGYQALYNSDSLAGSNTAVGKDSLLNSTTGSSNTAIGSESGKNNTTGYSNTFVGALAGSAVTTGDGNVFVGLNAGGFNNVSSFTGTNCIALGSSSNPSTLTVNNEITLGNSDHTVIRAAVTSITSLSDARDKKEIEELPVGLEFIKKLKPVKFVWDDRDEKGRHDVKDFGFIAQDLKKAQEDIELANTLKLVYESNPDKLEASYGKLVPILVKAIQDLSAKVEALEK
jgi:trimeric autotransporter adhesin